MDKRTSQVNNQMAQPSSAQAKSSYSAFPDAILHEHNHRPTPHMHSQPCDRLVSGVDKNRSSRFYFTKQRTPCRVYLSYNEKLASMSLDAANSLERGRISQQLNPALNGRKLSPKTLRSQLRINPQFIEDAKNLIFVRETMSLVPVLPTITLNTQTGQTMAEMAVMPVNLPTIATNDAKAVHNHQHVHKLKPAAASNAKPTASTKTNALKPNNFQSPSNSSSDIGAIK
jgi:hypothetical protein